MNTHNNSHGFKNEIQFVDYLNQTRINDLNLNMKNFIKDLCDYQNIRFSNELKISAKLTKNNKAKQDFYIFINDVKYGISLKLGSSNSCHQEKVDEFCNFIKTNLNASDDICNLIRFFIYSDGTFNGSGDVSNRIKSKIFKLKYPDKINSIQDFLNKHKKELIERFVFVGKYNSTVDFIYHGNIENGVWLSKTEIIDFLINTNKKSKSTLNISRLSFQSWNLSLSGNTERNRGQIQVKYASMKKDLNQLMMQKSANIGTFFGDKEEEFLISTLNKNKSDSKWKIILPNINNYENIFLVRVRKRIYSNLSYKNVMPKADAYAVYINNIDKNKLLLNQYILYENEQYKKIEKTGISIKLKNSKNYTICKFSKESFIKAFSKYCDFALELFFANLVYVKESELFKNKFILDNLKINLTNLNKLFNSSYSHDIEYYTYIKKESENILRNIIDSDIDLKKAIFQGLGWFDEPYVAHFIYKNSELTKNIITNYTITTGSGRSKGNYTIIIK